MIILRHFIFQNRVLLPGLIKMELLRGAVSEEAYTTLKSVLEGLIYLPVDDDFWNRVSAFFFDLHNKGINVPIAYAYIGLLAIEQNVLLLHRDHQFDRLAENSELKVLKTFKKIKTA